MKRICIVVSNSVNLGDKHFATERKLIQKLDNLAINL
jgi:hypothetical protein